MSKTHSRRGPDFMCIGLQKAGTRWLYLELKQHPQFWMPPIKELHFFDKRKFPAPRIISRLSKSTFVRAEDRAFANHLKQIERQSTSDIEVYASLFDPAGGMITGDITPAYGALPPHQIEQIARRFPELKVLLMLRDPISRLWSNVNDAANKGVIAAQSLLSAEGMRRTIELEIFLSGSYPARTYRKWASVFPKEKIKTCFFNDVVASPEATRSDVLAFLSASPGKSGSDIPSLQNSKAGRPRATMSESVRAFLIATFEEELRDCARLFGGHANDWLALYGLSDPHAGEAALHGGFARPHSGSPPIREMPSLEGTWTDQS